MIIPSEIPQIPCDIESLIAQADILVTASGEFSATGADVDSEWQALDDFYDAPEDQQLFDATAEVKTRSADVADKVTVVGDALKAYAEEIESLKSELESVKSEAEDFVAENGSNEDWQEDAGKVFQNSMLLGRVNEAVSAWMTAQRTCANKIIALWCGIPYVEDNADGNVEANEFGYSKELLDTILAEGSELPWGAIEEVDDGWFVEGVEGVGGFFVDFGEVAWGNLEGLGTLVGFSGADAMGDAWLGMFEFSMAINPTFLIVNSFTDMPGLEQGALLDTLAETGKGLVAWDQWAEGDVSGALAVIAFNVVTIGATKGAGLALKGTTIAARITEVAATIATKFPTVASVASKISAITDPLGVALAEIKLPALPWTKTPDLTPDGTGKPGSGDFGDTDLGDVDVEDIDVDGLDTSTPGDLDATSDGPVKTTPDGFPDTATDFPDTTTDQFVDSTPDSLSDGTANPQATTTPDGFIDTSPDFADTTTDQFVDSAPDGQFDSTSEGQLDSAPDGQLDATDGSIDAPLEESVDVRTDQLDPVADQDGSAAASSDSGPIPPAQDVKVYDISQSLDPEFTHETDPTHPENIRGWKVDRLTDAGREEYRVYIDQDGLVRNASNGTPFDTSAGVSGWTNNDGRAIFVMDDKGNIFASNKAQIGEHHHSTLGEGTTVASAGELVVHDGVLQFATDGSGHYKPGPEHMYQLHQELIRHNLDKILIFDHQTLAPIKF